MVRDVVGPLIELRVIGQLTIQNQIGRLEVRAFLRQLLDGISAIPQDAFIAVDVSDLALAQGCIAEGRVVAHHTEVIRLYFYLAQVDRPDRVMGNWKFVAFSRPVIGNGDGVPRHGSGPLGNSRRFRFNWIHYFSFRGNTPLPNRNLHQLCTFGEGYPREFRSPSPEFDPLNETWRIPKRLRRKVTDCI